MKLPLVLFSLILMFGCATRPPSSGIEDFAVVEAFLTNAMAPLKPTSHPQKQPTVAPAKKSLVQLEVEELRIRKDATLTRAERMQKLREIWKQQLAVMGK